MAKNAQKAGDNVIVSETCPWSICDSAKEVSVGALTLSQTVPILEAGVSG